MTVSHRKARASNAVYYLSDASLAEGGMMGVGRAAMPEPNQAEWLIRGCTDQITKALLGLNEGAWQSERDANVFLSLAAGFAKDGVSGAVSLVQNAGSAKRVALHDFTLSAPKSVSVVWALADESIRVQIEQAQQRAAHAFVSLLGEEAAYSRQGKAGRYRAPCSVVAALFPHFISRSGDPQIHTHCVMLNVVVRFDGTTGGLETRGMMRLLGVAATRYHELLAEGMQQLGFRVRPRGKLFEIDGVPVEACDEFSRRRAAALAHVKETEPVQMQSDERSFTSRKRMQVAILKTRPRRRVYVVDRLREQWVEQAQRINFDMAHICLERKIDQTDRA